MRLPIGGRPSAPLMRPQKRCDGDTITTLGHKKLRVDTAMSHPRLLACLFRRRDDSLQRPRQIADRLKIDGAETLYILPRSVQTVR